MENMFSHLDSKYLLETLWDITYEEYLSIPILRQIEKQRLSNELSHIEMRLDELSNDLEETQILDFD